MPTFTYRAYNDQQKAYRSTIESSNLKEAKIKLSDEGISFVWVKETSLKTSYKLKKKTLLLFTEELLSLLSANLPLYDALKLLKEHFLHHRLSTIIDTLREKLKGGSSFSEALKEYPQHFDTLYCTLIEMGEKSGQLEEALKHLSHELSKECQTAKKFKAALLYPAVLSIFCILVLAVLIGYVVPSIEALFEFSKLGAFTQTVISICHHLKAWGLIYLVSLIVWVFILKWAIRSKRYKRSFDQLVLSLPKVRSFVKDFQFYRWATTLKMLLNGGVPLIESLSLAENTQSNLILKDALVGAKQKVLVGRSLSKQLKEYSYFSPLIIQMIAIGESSGDLVSSFDKISALLEDNVEKKLHQCMTLLTPLSLLIMATLVGLIMLAILIPLTDINSLIS